MTTDTWFYAVIACIAVWAIATAAIFTIVNERKEEGKSGELLLRFFVGMSIFLGLLAVAFACIFGLWTIAP